MFSLIIPKSIKSNFEETIVERTLEIIRREYTVMPRFGYHQPLDYGMDTLPPKFDQPVWVDGEALPLPPVVDRMGYSADDADYLEWGRYDKGLIQDIIRRYLTDAPLKVLDFGCSSGRVLRHFYQKSKLNGWRLFGVDIQARPIQWMREHFPDDFCVYTGSTLPTLPFPDNFFDVVYGISCFTHIKYNWDMWLLELSRVIKPGGLLIQTIHTENAWRFYHEHRHLDWVRSNHSALMLETSEMPHDYFYYGDISVSQVFWRRDTALKFWGRYLEVIEIMPPPPEPSFQDWMICRKPSI